MKGAEVIRCLGNETRYKLACLLKDSDSYVELLAEKLGLTAGTVCFHLKKMEAAGIVKCSRSQFYIIYSLNRELLSLSMGDCLEAPREDSADSYRKKVIASFFKGGKLTAIPVQEKKRRIVLEEIMKNFPVGEYTEADVNSSIAEYHEDYCTIRRWLVADGFMTREHETYTVRTP